MLVCKLRAALSGASVVVVTQAMSGKTALEAAMTNQFDLLVIDEAMGDDMSGLDIARRLRSDPQGVCLATQRKQPHSVHSRACANIYSFDSQLHTFLIIKVLVYSLGVANVAHLSASDAERGRDAYRLRTVN